MNGICVSAVMSFDALHHLELFNFNDSIATPSKKNVLHHTPPFITVKCRHTSNVIYFTCDDVLAKAGPAALLDFVVSVNSLSL